MAERVVSLRWIAVGVFVLAIGLPPVAAAGWLQGVDVAPAEVVAGVWVFKMMLAVHAVLLWWMPTVWPSPRPPTVDGGGGRWFEPGGALGGQTETILVLAILMLGTAVRLIDLSSGLWYDEITTLTQHVRLPLGRLLTTFESQNQQPLYSLSAHAGIALFGDTNWVLRLPAVAFGVLSLAAVYGLGRMITRSWEPLFATGFLALSYHHVWFSQNARAYSALLCGTLVLSALFLRMIRIDERSGAQWTSVAYAVVAACSAYANITVGFVVAAHALVWLGLRLRRPFDKGGGWIDGPLVAYVLSATFTLQLYALVLPQFWSTLTTPTMAGVASEWKSPIWLVVEAVTGLARGLPGGVLTVAFGAIIGFAGLWTLWRRDRVATVVMLLPALLLAAALTVLEHNLWPRLFFFAFGFGSLIVGFGISTVVAPFGRTARWLGPVVGGLVIVASATTLPGAWGPKQDYAGAHEFVVGAVQEGDAVVTVDLAQYPFDAYLRTEWIKIDDMESLLALEQRAARTWVVYTFPTRLTALQPEIWDRLQQEYTKVGEYPGTVSGGDIVIMRRG